MGDTGPVVSAEMPLPDMPDDVVQGSDPEFSCYRTVRVVAYECPCGYRTYTTDDRAMHGFLAHPASRNPDLTCQATAPWDHERWCIRAKGHEGDHWTPSAAGGAEWVNR